MATRCFSPPESVRRPCARAASPMPSRSTTSSKLGRGARRAARTSGRRAGSAARSDAETAGRPGTRSRCARWCVGTNDAARRCRPARAPPTAMRPALGPDQAGDRVDQRGLARARAAEQRGRAAPSLRTRASSWKLAEPRAGSSTSSIAQPAIRAATRRASTSEASSAAIEIAIETSVSRSAPASPPGTCVKV